MRPVYMDNHATTPLDPRVLEAMLPYFRDSFGNPSSKQHTFGLVAAAAVDKAREHVAALIGANDPNEIIFTASATEANNLALKGIECTHVASAHTEHSSVLAPLQKKRVTWLPVDGEGVVQGAVPNDADLVCLMLANNEIGTVQPLAKLDRKNALLVTDAVQAAGHIPIDVKALGVDALSLSAHKFHGPKGAAALWVRRSKPRVPLTPLIEGGSHERGLRAGTLNVPAIVGFGEAARIAKAELGSEGARLRGLRDRLFHRIAAGLDGITLNGPSLAGDRLPHNLNLSFANVDGGALLLDMRNVAVSSGSACGSGSLEPSHVLRAIGRSDELAHAALRFGLGRFTTEEEVDYAADETIRVVRELRSKRC